MNRMAAHTVFHGQLHLRAVRFMACAAFRDVAMLFSVAVGTGHLGGMPAGVILDFVILIGMTKAAGGLNLSHRDYQGLVRIRMAFKAGD